MTRKPAPEKPAATPTIPRKKPPLHQTATRKPAMTDSERGAMDEFGRHEVLHMSIFLCNSVDRELLEHEQIKNNPAWQALAETAHQALFDLYQAIGAVHLVLKVGNQRRSLEIEPARLCRFLQAGRGFVFSPPLQLSPRVR